MLPYRHAPLHCTTPRSTRAAPSIVHTCTLSEKPKLTCRRQMLDRNLAYIRDDPQYVNVESLRPNNLAEGVVICEGLAVYEV